MIVNSATEEIEEIGMAGDRGLDRQGAAKDRFGREVDGEAKEVGQVQG